MSDTLAPAPARRTGPGPRAPREARPAFGGAATMTARALRLSSRNIDALITALLLPVLLMLVFVHLFGGAIDTGTRYVTYVVPGVLVLCAGYGSAATAVSVSTDMTGGIIDRFRTMAIARGAVLTGHVIGTLLQTLAVLALVVGVSLAMGFRPAAGPLAWLAAAGVLMLFAVALIWLSTALGLAAKSVETASNTPMFLTLLPFLSGGFVLISTLPAGLRQFAEYQPFTPVIQTTRGLLTGGPVGAHAIAAVAWSAGIALACYLWSIRLYDRRRAADPK